MSKTDSTNSHGRGKRLGVKTRRKIRKVSKTDADDAAHRVGAGGWSNTLENRRRQVANAAKIKKATKAPSTKRKNQVNNATAKRKK